MRWHGTEGKEVNSKGPSFQKESNTMSGEDKQLVAAYKLSFPKALGLLSYPQPRLIKAYKSKNDTSGWLLQMMCEHEPSVKWKNNSHYSCYPEPKWICNYNS